MPWELFKMVQAAFTNFDVDVDDELQDGDKAVVRISFMGSDTGDFMGRPPAGNPVKIDAIDIVQLRGDECVAHWGVGHGRRDGADGRRGTRLTGSRQVR